MVVPIDWGGGRGVVSVGMVVVGDARSLPVGGGVVQCVVTSPPYWGLRDYGTARWEGGDAACDHRQQLGGEGVSSAKQNTSAGTQSIAYRDVCGKCGARRIDAQLGLEATPDLYVASMVGVFREVWRVLREDGTLWLNLGSSYAGGGGFCETAPSTATSKSGKYGSSGAAMKSAGDVPGFKAKDLVPIPWMVAMALQADGWYLRSDIIWSKPNPMPESVTDRPTKAHEYVFLLTKAARYYWDAEAVREANTDDMLRRSALGHTRGANGKVDASRCDADTLRGEQAKPILANGRNLRSVWSIATQPYPEAHFATMPEKLVEPCIKAGSKPGDWVLDPFTGSGTVGRVAHRFNRRFVGVELNPAYVGLSQGRMSGVQRSLLEVGA